MTKSTMNKDNKKKETSTRLPNCPHTCPFCGKNPDEWIRIYYKELAKLDEKEKNAYKIGAMNKKNSDFKPPTKEEFDKLLMVALNTPPRKRTKKDRKS